jgi:hypothetical protein
MERIILEIQAKKLSANSSKQGDDNLKGYLYTRWWNNVTVTEFAVI